MYVYVSIHVLAYIDCLHTHTHTCQHTPPYTHTHTHAHTSQCCHIHI